VECLLFEGVSIKLLDFLILNDDVKLFFEVINIGLKAFVRYFLLVLIAFVMFAVVGYIIYGPYLQDFSTFQSSIAVILFLTVGYYDLRTIIFYAPGWGTFYMMVFWIIILLFIYVIFISLFAEGLKKTVVQNGYPEDYEGQQWQFKDYIVWLCHFVKEDEEVKK